VLAEIQTWTPGAGEEQEVLDVAELRGKLADKTGKQSLQAQLSTNWHKREVSTLMDHYKADTKKLAFYVSNCGNSQRF
jgi:hypothetical protein